MTMKQRSGKGKRPKFHWFREVTIIDLQITKSGNSYCVKIPHNEMEKNHLKVGNQVRPVLTIPASELKTKNVRFIPLPITTIKQDGRSPSIRIPMYIFKRYKLSDSGKVLFLTLVVKDIMDVNLLNPGDVIVYNEGIIETIPKSRFIKMKYAYEQMYDQN